MFGVDRFESGVLGLQPHASVLAEEALHRRLVGGLVLARESDDDLPVARGLLPPHDDEVLLWADFVPQETLYWRRRIWEQVGGTIDQSFSFAVDWDLLLRFREAGAKIVRLPRFLGAFRVHPEQKTSAQIGDTGLREMTRLRERAHGRPVTQAEVEAATKKYVRRHIVEHKLYRIGVLKY